MIDFDAVDANDVVPGERVGGFLLLDSLARGGMGQVFAAVDVETGRELVIKVPASLGTLVVESFEAEISTLAGLRHESIVKIVDYGIFRGHPWYAMERIHGDTLRTLLELDDSQRLIGDASPKSTNLPTQRIDGASPPAGAVAPPNPIEGRAPALERKALFQLCWELLGVLEYLHSQRVVHGDLKPDNIFVLDQARPVLVDFGLAASFDSPRDVLSAVPRTVGTAAYMAPERILGRAFDARSDYYALGCLMYECLTGSNPFARADVQGTMLAQLRFQPPALSSLDPSIPTPISRLVERLLAKSPLDRPGYAAEIRAVMAGHSTAAGTHAAPPSKAAYLHRSPLFGRATQLTAISTHLSGLNRSRGGHLRITGAAGSGKTRLLMKAVDLAEDQGVDVVRIVGASTGERGRPFEGIRSLLWALDPPHASSSPDPYTSREPLAQALEHNALKTDEAARQVVRSLLSHCAATATMVAIDHLGGIDSASQIFLRALAGTDLSEHPLLVIWADAPQGQPAGWHPMEIQTTALTRDEVGAATQAMLAVERSSAQLLESAYRVSEGNPYLLRCYLQLLIDDSVLIRTPLQGWHVDNKRATDLWSAESLGSARSLFARAIDRLTPSQRRFASFAAALGRTFRTSMLASVTEASELEVAAALAGLAQDHIVELVSENRYRFTHSQLRTMLANRLEPDLALALHRQAARALAAEAERDSGIASDVAAHLSKSGQYAEAARYHRMAACAHEARGEHDDAITCLEHAIRALERLTAEPGGDLLIELLERLGDSYLSVRKLSSAAQVYERALTGRVPSSARAARLHRKLAAAHDRDRRVALRHLDQALRILEAERVQSSDDRAEWIESHLAAMFIHYWSQETAEVLARGEIVRPYVFAAGTEAQRASYHFNLAAALMLHRRFVTGAEELDHISKAMQLYSDSGNVAKVSMCQFLRALILYFAGDLTPAEQSFSELLATAERNVTATLQLRSLTYVTLIARLKGEHNRVRRLAGSALSLAQEHGMREYEGTALANLAWLALDDGDASGCIDLARQARIAWADSPARCVYQWVAYIPWMAAQLETQASEGWTVLSELAAQVLHESQQLPPPALGNALERLRTVPTTEPREISKAVRRVVEEARSIRWL